MTTTWEFWNGQRVPGANRMAFDTETRAEKLDEVVPEGVLLTAWAGGDHPVQVVAVERWPQFVLMHQDREWVGHNTPFDFHVVLEELKRQGFGAFAQPAWVGLAATGKMFCTQLLDAVVRLASGEVDLGTEPDSKRPIRNLEKLTHAYGLDCAPPDKASPFRKRFGKLLDQPDWNEVDRGFFDYAASDTVATWHLGEKLLERAWSYHNKIDREKLHPKADEYGPLTARLQLRGAIALADISRRGFLIDVDLAWRTEVQKRTEYQEQLKWIEDNYPGLIKTEKESETRVVTRKKKGKKKKGKLEQGELFAGDEPAYEEKVTVRAKGKRKGRRVTSSKSQVVAMDHKRLSVILEDIAQDLGVEKRLTETGKISRKADDWVEHADKSEFLKRWSRIKELEKTLSFMVLFRSLSPDNPIFRSKYVTMVRTARTSAFSPNVQQAPKDEWFRQHFIARPGKLLYTVDYAAIELATLAYLCEKWLGKSKLGEVLRSGKDPHCYTASLVIDEPYEKVFSEVKKEKAKDWPKDKPKVYSGYRQSSKAVLFGLGGGLGATRLVAYAKLSYGVDMTLAEATTLRDKLMYVVYPELTNRGGGWLSSDPVDTIARNLQLPYDQVFDLALEVDGCFSRLGICLERVLRGCPVKADGTRYNERYIDKLWNLARRLAIESPVGLLLREKFQNGYQPADEIADFFFLEAALTTVGNVRTGVTYTERCNGPFQGQAAGGAKNALWNLWKAGFQTCAFVHDEVVVEIDEEKKEEQAAAIDRIMIDSMGEVVEGFPVKVEGHWDTCWKK